MTDADDWMRMPAEIRKLIILTYELLESRLRPTTDFPMSFVNPHVMVDIEEVMKLIVAKYYLQIKRGK